MPRRQRTSRHFLRHLLPREGLSAEQRVRLDTVLRENDTQSMRDLAAELTEALVAQGRFRQLGDDHYLDPVTGRHIRLLAKRAHSSNGGPPAPTPAQEIVEQPLLRQSDFDTNRQVAAILRAVQLEGRDPGLAQGLLRLLALLGEWFPESVSVLHCLADAGVDVTEPSIVLLDLAALPSDNPYRGAAESGEPFVLLKHEPKHESKYESKRDLEPEPAASTGAVSESLFITPLTIDDEIWGLLELRLPGDKRADAVLDTLVFLGQALSHQIHNHRVLSQVVYVDWLTQVLNRSWLDRQLPLEIERATRNDEPLTLLVADIDDFKRINDTFGHDVGDQVLREFSKVIRNTLRKVDQIFRFGGEEFVILLPRLDLESAIRAAERLRSGIERHAFGISNNGLEHKVTASIGGAIFPENALGETALFKAADQACLNAKRQGKNRVVFAETEIDLRVDLD